MSYKITDWTGCYDGQWKGKIIDEAFSHPAKFSHNLIQRIYQHALATGLIAPGGVVVDPFGGVALGGLHAMQSGLHWVGCELEARFVDLGQQNIALWNERYAPHFPRWGTAQLLQGDSRRLAEVIAAAGIVPLQGLAGLVVSSPPYAGDSGKSDKTGHERAERRAEEKGFRQGLGCFKTSEAYGSTEGQLGAMKPGQPPTAVIASPPFAGNTGGRGDASRNGIDSALFDRHSGGMKKGTGSDPANLDHLPMMPRNTRRGMGTLVLGSPPYAGSLERPNGIDASKIKKPGGNCSQSVTDPRYGSTNGQLGAMVVGSPPFAESIGSDDPAKRGGLLRTDPKRAGDVNLTGSYGDTPGQLGAMKAGAVVGSPPFENSLDRGVVDPAGRRELARANGISNAEHISPIDMERVGKRTQEYGSTDGQLGTDSGETFWAAAKTIIDQCYQILPEHGAAIWVVKNYVKSGREVQFSEQWRLLCEACGFETVEVIRAWLVKRNGAQAGFDGEMVSKDVARKSFFRRLAEAKGSPPIDFETVLIMRKRKESNQ